MSHFIVCQASASSFPSGTLRSSPHALFRRKTDQSPEHLLPVHSKILTILLLTGELYRLQQQKCLEEFTLCSIH